MSGLIRSLTKIWCRPRSLIIAATIATVSAGGLVAWAAWSSQGNGPGAAKSLSMPSGNTPTLSLSGTTVTVTWAGSDFANGAAVQGYRIQRYADGTTTPITPGATCSGTIAALMCAENAVPGGTWRYTVIPRQGTWTGAESPMSLPITVSTSGPIATATSVHSSVTPSVFGQSVTFTATVAPAPPANETVTFADGGTTLGTAPLNAGGFATLSTATLTVGSHAISASYGGDSNFVASSGSTAQVVNKASTTVALTSSDNAAVFGESLSFTASVTAVAPGVGTVDGSVQFKVDGVNLGGAVTLAGGSATSAATTTLSVGSHTVTVVYSGSANFNGATGTLSQNVGKAGTTTVVTSGTNPSVFGQMVTFTATVSATAPGAGTPGGLSVTFTDGSTTLGTATLSGGTATFMTSLLSVGNHTIGARYDGDANFNGSTAAPITQTVGQADTTTVVTASINPSVFGQAVIFTATVSAVLPGAGSRSGSVQFRIDGNNFGALVTLLNGKAFSDPTTALSVGPHVVTAIYGGDGNFHGSSSAAFTQTVGKADTSTSVTGSSANPSVFGQAVTFTAAVSAMPPGAGTPTGSVQFSVGAVNLGAPVPLSGGTATSPAISSLPVGTSAISASYTGDGNFTGSASPAFTQTVNKDATTTAVTSSANPSVVGQSVTFTATASANAPGSGTPTGTVTFSEGATTLGTGTLIGASATFTTSSLSVGNHTITAGYGGDGNFLSSASSALQQVSNQAPTTTTLSSSSNPSVFGQPVTFTAIVTVNAPGSGTPTGTVTFADGTITLGTGTLSGGTATFTTSDLSTTTFTLTATYSGDGNFASSSVTLSQTINKADTMTTLTASATSSVFGETVTFTPTVAAVAPSSASPAGLWFLYDGSTALAGAGVTASIPISTLAPGTHSLTAHYNGNGNFNTSVSAPVTVIVSQASTTTALASAPNPSVFGQSVTFTATVSVILPGSGLATGTVTFTEGATALGTGSLNGSGQATFAASSLSVGGHTVTASYAGDTNFTASTSGSVTQTVNKATSATVVISSQNPSAVGQPVTFTATVSAVAPGAGTPTGTVTFHEGASALASAALDATGQASFATSALPAGTHTITADYGGDSGFTGSTGNVIQAVNQGLTNTTTTVVASANPSLFGDSVIFTATVTPAPPAGEMVTFMDGSTTLGTGALGSGGVATFATTSTLSLGSHNINALYPGDSTLLASTGTLSQQVSRIIISPSIVTSNGSVTVRGAGWPANDPSIQVYIGPISPGYGYACSVASDGAGAFSQNCPVNTNLAHGTYTATATDGTITDTGNSVTVNPALANLNPTYTNPGSPVSVFGSGFAANSNIAVTLGGVAVTASVGTTNYLGGVGSLTFNVPSGTPAGATTIAVTDSASPPNRASIAFTVYNATIAISPSTAASASAVTVSGSGWPLNGTAIAVYIGPVSPGYGFACNVAADATGAFSQICGVNPNLAQGTYPATASDGSITATGNQVTVNPAIGLIYPGYANPTNSVRVAASGFAANSNITAKLGGVAVTPSVTSTDAVGSVDFTFNVPSGTAAGATTFAVTDGASPPNSASEAFTVYNATISVSPTTTTSGSSVTVSGSGWPTNDPSIRVYLGLFSNFLCNVAADASGAFSQSCPVGTYLAQGTYTASAFDFAITATGNAVTVNPAITHVSPTYGSPTTLVVVVGSGFAPNSNVTVKLGGVVVTPSGASTDASGTVNPIFYVPSGMAAGVTTITVTDSASPPNSASIGFTVYNATISMSPTTVTRPSAVSVSGSGWPASATIGVWLGPVGTNFICYVYADAGGTIAPTSCTISTGVPAGTYTVTASDGYLTTTGNQEIVN